MNHYTFTLRYNTATTKVRVLESASLSDLAKALLTSIDFECDHAFGFHSSLDRPHTPGQKKEFSSFADIGEKFVAHDTGAAHNSVSSIFTKGETLLFHFDYGADWMFLVTCEDIEKNQSRKKKPEILEVKGELPQQYPNHSEPPPASEVPSNIIPFPSPSNEHQSPSNLFDEETEHDRAIRVIIEINGEILGQFSDYLSAKNLSQKTINKHISNIQFYGDEYILHYTDEKRTVDQAILPVEGFLGSWFIRKCLWSSENTMKEFIASFKKFFGWRYETGSLTQEDYDDFSQMVKQQKSQWIETLRKYKDLDVAPEDIFPNYF